MTNKVLGGGSLDGSLGLNPDFSTLTIPLGRVVQSVDNEGYIQYWIIEETLKAGGNALSNGLYANSTTLKEVAGGVSKLSEQNRQAIEAVYKAQGYNNVFFFEDGFTYTESNDVGIYEDGTAWIYADAGALPVTIAAGTVPSEGVYKAAKVKASSVELNSGESVQDFKDSKDSEWKFTEQGWSLGGGRVIVAEPESTYVNSAANIDSVTVTGGRGYISDPNQGAQPDGTLRLRNSYYQMVGYVRESQTDIGGTIYDNWRLAEEVNPSVAIELCQVIGGGDNSCNGLANQMVGALHCDTSVWGNHVFMHGGTYNLGGGFYSFTVGGTNNENFGNRSLILSSNDCRIGIDGTDLASAVANASLTRHSKIIGSYQCTTDVSHSQPDGHVSTTTKDFGKAYGFGASSEIYGGHARSSAPFRVRGDNQVESFILARTTTTGLETNLLSTTNWSYKSEASAQEKTNASGLIVIGTNTTLIVKGTALARQTDGDGIYTADVTIVCDRGASGDAVLHVLVVDVIYSNRDTATPSSDYLITASVSSGAILSIRGKGLNGETVNWQFEGSLKRIRNLTSTAIVPPIPFDTI